MLVHQPRGGAPAGGTDALAAVGEGRWLDRIHRAYVGGDGLGAAVEGYRRAIVPADVAAGGEAVAQRVFGERVVRRAPRGVTLRRVEVLVDGHLAVGAVVADRQPAPCIAEGVRPVVHDRLPRAGDVERVVERGAS